MDLFRCIRNNVSYNCNKKIKDGPIERRIKMSSQEALKAMVSLSKDLVAVTEEGRVQDWIERMAVIAREAELPLARIKWQGSPNTVAHDIARISYSMGKIEELKKIVEARKES